jgi:hypothetical protein
LSNLIAASTNLNHHLLAETKQLTRIIMPISQATLEEAIRAAIPCQHLVIEDTSNGCGENYAILVVSESFEGKTTLARHRWSEYRPSTM